MAKEKKVAEVSEVKEEKKSAKKAAKKEAVKEVSSKFPKATIHDHEVIIEPIITEKSMSLTSEENKATFKVQKDANKIEIKNAIQRIYGVKVLEVKTVNVKPKRTTRGSRFQGKLSGYKKAVVRLESGQAIDLFKE